MKYYNTSIAIIFKVFFFLEIDILILIIINYEIIILNFKLLDNLNILFYLRYVFVSFLYYNNNYTIIIIIIGIITSFTN